MAERNKTEGGPAPAKRRTRETAADRARLGVVIAGSYRIDELLGRGAIGAVFGGMHLRLERPIAIKFVDPSLVDDPEIRARFKREARIAAQIGSSHAVEVFDYGLSDDGSPFLVMERLVGEDLHARILREGKLPASRALAIAKQVCRALGAAHANGIVHRDLKPENVFLVDRDGDAEFVKVVDFGLSTFVQSDDTRLTRAGQSVGTPLYMAPEQAGASHFDARVDVYSLGVMIFEMTTGRLPFEATTLQQLLVQLASGTPRTLRDYDPTLPVELEELVKRFTMRDPSRRPRSAAASLAEIVALEDTLSDRYDNYPSAGRRKAATAVDGQHGAAPGAFTDEVNIHLAELRRTGSLSTSDVESEPEPMAQTMRAPSVGSIRIVPVSEPHEPPPPSSGGEHTDVMDRQLIDSLLSDPQLPVAPSTGASSASRIAKRKTDDHDESLVFAGRRDPRGVITELVSPRREESPTLPPNVRLIATPARWVLWAAFAAFLAAFVSVLVRVMLR